MPKGDLATAVETWINAKATVADAGVIKDLATSTGRDAMLEHLKKQNGKFEKFDETFPSTVGVHGGDEPVKPLDSMLQGDADNFEVIKNAAQAKAYLLLDEHIKEELKNSNNSEVLKAIASAEDNLSLNDEPLRTQLAVIGGDLYGALSETEKAKKGYSDDWRKEASNRIKAILLSKIDAITNDKLQQLALLANTAQGDLDGQAAAIAQAFDAADIDEDVIKGLARCDGYDDLQKAAAKRIAKGVLDKAVFAHGDSQEKAIQLAALAHTAKDGLAADSIAPQLGDDVSEQMIQALAQLDDAAAYTEIQKKARDEFKAYLKTKLVSADNKDKLTQLAGLTTKDKDAINADKAAIAPQFADVTENMLEWIKDCPEPDIFAQEINEHAKAQITAHITDKITAVGDEPEKLKALALLATKSKANIQADTANAATDIAHLDDGTLDAAIIQSLGSFADISALQQAAANKMAEVLTGKLSADSEDKRAALALLITTDKASVDDVLANAFEKAQFGGNDRIKKDMVLALKACGGAVDQYEVLQQAASKAYVSQRITDYDIASISEDELKALQHLAEAENKDHLDSDALIHIFPDKKFIDTYKQTDGANLGDIQREAAHKLLLARIQKTDNPAALKDIVTSTSVVNADAQSIKNRLSKSENQSLGFSDHGLSDAGARIGRQRLRALLTDDKHRDYQQAAQERACDLLKQKLAETAADVSKRDETIAHLKTLLDNQDIGTAANLWTQHGRDEAFKAVLGMPDPQAQALVEALGDDGATIAAVRGAIAEQVVDLAVDKALDEVDLTNAGNPIKALIEADTADSNNSDFLKALANGDDFGLRDGVTFNIKTVLETKAQQDKLRQQAAIALFKKSFSVHEFDTLSALLEANQNGTGFASALLDHPTDDTAFEAKYGQVKRDKLKAIFHDPNTQTALRDALKSHAESLRAVKATGLGQEYAGVGEQYQKAMYFPATYLEHARQITELSDIGTPLSRVADLAQGMNRALAMHQSDKRIGDVVPQYRDINHGVPEFGKITKSSQFHLKAASVSQALFGDGRATAKLVAAYEDGTHRAEIEEALSKLSRYVDKDKEVEAKAELQTINNLIGGVSGMTTDVARGRVADNIYFQNLSRRIYGNTDHVSFLKRAYAANNATFLTAVHPFVHANRKPGTASVPTLQVGRVADIAEHEKFLVHDDTTNDAKQALEHLATLVPDAPAIDTEEHAKQVRRGAAIRYLAHPPKKAYKPYIGQGTGDERSDATKRNKSIDEELTAAKTVLDKDLEALLSPKIQQYLDPEAIEKNIHFLQAEVEAKWDELLPALMANKEEGQKRLSNLEAEITKRAMIMSALAKQKVALEERKQAVEAEVQQLKAEHVAGGGTEENFKLPKKLKEYKTKLDTALATSRRSYQLHDRLHRRLERLHLKITQYDVGGILKSERWASRRVKASELDTVLKQPALGTAAPSNLTLAGVSKWGASSELLPSDEVMLHEKTVPIDVSGNSKLSVQRITQPDGTMKMYATQHTPGAAEENDRVKRVSISAHPNEPEMMNMAMDMVIEFIEQNGLPSEENPLIISGRDDKARVATYVALKHLLNGDKTFGGEFSDCKKHVYMPGMDEKAIKKDEKAYAKSLKSGPEFSKRQREVQAIAQFDKSFKSKGTQVRKQEISKIREQLGLTEDEVNELQPPSRMNGGPN